MRPTTTGNWALVTVALGVSHAAGQSFVPLGDLPGGPASSVVWDVNADGRVVVGQSLSASGAEAFRWEDGVMVGLGDIEGGGFSSTGNAVSADGSVVVGRGFVDAVQAMRWTRAGMVGLGFLGNVDPFSWAEDVNADGSVVVGRSSNNGTSEAFVWTEAEGMSGIGYLVGGESSTANGVSPSGTIVVGQGDSSGGDRAYRWTLDQGMRVLDAIDDSLATSAFAVNDEGLIVGTMRNFDETDVMVMWRPDGQLVILGDLAGGDTDAAAYGVSADARRVVGYGTDADTMRPVLWTEQAGLRALDSIIRDDYGIDLSGWVLTEARGISADGLTVVGNGTNPAGAVEAWLFRFPDPCPADFNTDGIVDSRDLIAFLNVWGARDLGADMDGNGVVDSRDVLVFLNDWAAAC